MKSYVDWSQAEPWLMYAVQTQLFEEPRERLLALHGQALADPKMQAWLADVAAYHDMVVSSHKNMNLPLHKLLFLLDLGYGEEVPQIAAALSAIRAHRDAAGVYASMVNIPTHFGGSGQPAFGWALCDAPLLAAAVLLAGAPAQGEAGAAVRALLATATPVGFPCAASPELGSFRGPGKKADPCPYATLAMLRLLALIPELAAGEAARFGVEALLMLWEQSMTRHPYLFYMGTDFRKLKAPLVWYDLVSVLDCLSRFPYAVSDARFGQMLALLESKQAADGGFTPESVYKACEKWDFGQKKKPSPTLTFYCMRIARRAGRLEA